MNCILIDFIEEHETRALPGISPNVDNLTLLVIVIIHCFQLYISAATAWRRSHSKYIHRVA